MSGDRLRLPVTPSQTIGPFFHFCLGPDSRAGCLVPTERTAERIRLHVRVVDGDGAPVPDALIELYHADGAGQYLPGPHASPSSGFCGFGRLPTDGEGSCVFETVRPGGVPDGKGGRQASHINVCVFARGLLKHLYSRVYFPDDPEHARDPLLTLVPDDRRTTLMAVATETPGTWTFDIHLQGSNETVFFDL